MRGMGMAQIVETDAGKGSAADELVSSLGEAVGLNACAIFAATNEGIATLPDAKPKQLLGLPDLMRAQLLNRRAVAVSSQGPAELKRPRKPAPTLHHFSISAYAARQRHSSARSMQPTRKPH
jgi:hypothetical protein